MSHKKLKRYAPIIISVALIIVLVSYSPFHEVWHVLADLEFGTIVILVALSLVYYGLKIVRFWYLLQAIGINQPFKLVALSYISAQPVSLLPAGEIYRSHELRRHTGVPIEKSLPQFTMQGILEGSALGALMLVSALALGTLRIPAISVIGGVLLFTVLLSRGFFADITHIINRLPFVNLSEADIRRFSERNKKVLTWQWLPLLFGLSILTELVGAGIAYTAVVGLGGHIDFYQAALLYIVPVVVGFVSLLPGGLGLSEQSAVGVLLLSHVKLAQAVASTIIMRATIVGLGVLYGVIGLIIGRVRVAETTKSA